jgi:hypothetical protein
MNVAYETYLHSPEWAERRRYKLQQAGHRCQGCDSDELLEVHHLTYDRVGHERPEDLMVLCNLCHAKEHGRAPSGQPAAGPTATDLVQRARRIDEQRRVLQRAIFLAGLEKLQHGMETIPDGLDKRQRKRIGSALHHLTAARREVEVDAALV